MKKLPLTRITAFCILIFATIFISSPVLAATKKMTVQQMKKKISEQQNTINLLKLKLGRCSGQGYSGKSYQEGNLAPAIDAPPNLKAGEQMMSFP